MWIRTNSFRVVQIAIDSRDKVNRLVSLAGHQESTKNGNRKIQKMEIFRKQFAKRACDP